MFATALLIASLVALPPGWVEVSDAAFTNYAAGAALDATNGARHGVWQVGTAKSAAMASDERSQKYMRLEATSGDVTFVSTRPGRAGGGNVLYFSLLTRPVTVRTDLAPGSKGGFLVSTDAAEGDLSFFGWTDQGWWPIAGSVAPSADEAWYDGAMRFRVADDGAVQVQYLLKVGEDYEILKAGEIAWFATGLTNRDAAVNAVDLHGVGGLESLSAREKNGFSLRLR